MKLSRCNSRGHIFYFHCRCGGDNFRFASGGWSLRCSACGAITTRGAKVLAKYDVPRQKRSKSYDVPSEKVIVP